MIWIGVDMHKDTVMVAVYVDEALGVGAAAAVSLTSALLYWLGRTLPGWPAEAPWNMRLQAACVAAALAIVLLVHVQLLAA